MSFSSNVKAELCRPPISRRTEALAEAYGVLLYCNTFTGSAVRVVTESRDFAERLPRLFKKAFGFRRRTRRMALRDFLSETAVTVQVLMI